MIKDLTYDSFAPHHGTEFAISSDGYDDVLTLTLLEYGKAPAFNGREPFLVSLRGARTDVMYNSGTFTLSHPVMGELELFINPVGKNADGTFTYHIPFN